MPTIEPIVSSLSNLSMVVTPLIFRKAPFFTPSSNSGSWSFLVKIFKTMESVKSVTDMITIVFSLRISLVSSVMT